jgi:imidazoleglycerol-phosphate dehydratase
VKRQATASRKTKETDIDVRLNLDGQGEHQISTEMGFFDHMLQSLTKHARFDLKIKAKGDLHVDFHHTVEDIGLVLGEALRQALGKKEGIERFGFGVVPMDEALARVSVDLSGRPFLVFNVKSRRKKIGDFDLTLFEEFFKAFCQTGLFNLHIVLEYGENPHHIYEAIFKALGRALKAACLRGGSKSIPSTKGVL